MKILTMVAALALLMVSPVLADCSPADKKVLEEFDRAWGEASIRGDRAALEQIYASDYMNLTPGNLESRSETIDSTIRDAENARLEPQQPPVAHDYYIIQCTPTTATITHRNIITTVKDGKTSTSYGRSVHMMEKRNNRWQVVSNVAAPLGDAGTIMYLEHEWNDADIRNDAAWFDKNYASDFTGISSRTGKLMNKREEIASMKTRKDSTTWAELRDLNVRTEGNTAVVTGVNHIKGRDDAGKAFDRKVAFTDVWVKRDGAWQVLASQGTEVKQ